MISNKIKINDVKASTLHITRGADARFSTRDDFVLVDKKNTGLDYANGTRLASYFSFSGLVVRLLSDF